MMKPESRTAAEHESAFVQAFVLRERRERYQAMLSNPKKRSVFLDRLNHRFTRDIDDRFVCQHPGFDPTTWSTPCYVIASEEQFDGRFVAASEVPATLASALFGMVVSYTPGQLVVYKDEAPSDPIWLRR